MGIVKRYHHAIVVKSMGITCLADMSKIIKQNITCRSAVTDSMH